MELPDVEKVAAILHEDWRAKKLDAGVTSRRDALTKEELMVPYPELSEHGKNLNRDPVRLVYAAIERLNGK